MLHRLKWKIFARHLFLSIDKAVYLIAYETICPL